MIALKNIAAATRAENGDMLSLARTNHEHTINLKTLTRITIFYLPASLIAVILTLSSLRYVHIDQHHCRRYSVLT